MFLIRDVQCRDQRNGKVDFTCSPVDVDKVSFFQQELPSKYQPTYSGLKQNRNGYQ